METAVESAPKKKFIVPIGPQHPALKERYRGWDAPALGHPAEPAYVRAVSGGSPCVDFRSYLFLRSPVISSL